MALLTHRDPLRRRRRARALDRRTAAASAACACSVPSIRRSGIRARRSSSTSHGRHDGHEDMHEFVVRLAPPTVGTFRDYDLAQQTIAQRAAEAAGRRHRGAGTRDRPAVARRSIRRDASRARAHRRRSCGVRRVAAVAHRNASAPTCTKASSVRWRRRTAPTLRPRPAFRRVTTKRNSSSGPTISNGRAVGRRCRRSSTRSHGAVRTDRRPNPSPCCSGAMCGSATSSSATISRRSQCSTGTWRRSARRSTTWPGAPRSRRRLAPCSVNTSKDFRIATERSPCYESLSGRTLQDFDWYEILAMIRSTSIMTRIGYLHRDAGLPSPLPIDDNPLLDLLAARIAAAGES